MTLQESLVALAHRIASSIQKPYFEVNNCWQVCLVVRLNAGREAPSNLLATHLLTDALQAVVLQENIKVCSPAN